MKLLAGPMRKATAAADSLTGKRFSLLVASSLVATTGIVAVGLSSAGGMSPMEAAAAKALLADESAVVAAAPAPAPEASPAPAPEAAPSAEAASPGPLPAPAPAPEAAPAPEPEAPEAPPAEPEAEPGPVQHVFVVSVASPGFEAAFGTTSQMPYLSGELRPQGVQLTNYSLLDPAPLPNAIAAVSGQPPNTATKEDCAVYKEFAAATANSRGVVSGDGCVYPVETLTLADQFVGARLRWHGYFEGMADAAGAPDNCVHPEPEAAELPGPSGYSARLNPFVYFHSLLDLGDCDENDVPLDGLAKDLRKIDTTANFSYVSPTPCNAGFRGQCPEGVADGPAAADAFLAEVVPQIVSSPAYKKDGLLIVAFGAADPDPAAPPPDPTKVGALLLSPLLAPGSTDAADYDPYSLLRSIEDLFGLEPLGAAGGAKVRSFASAFVAANGGD
ncbi:MAG TPA: alkaline phosphatase family protein [Solirubrobacterales bacterium]|nr:alkaline phosphatase family protein [Solirubrobacterales bacterium]